MNTLPIKELQEALHPFVEELHKRLKHSDLHIFQLEQRRNAAAMYMKNAKTDLGEMETLHFWSNISWCVADLALLFVGGGIWKTLQESSRVVLQTAKTAAMHSAKGAASIAKAAPGILTQQALMSIGTGSRAVPFLIQNSIHTAMSAAGYLAQITGKLINTGWNLTKIATIYSGQLPSLILMSLSRNLLDPGRVENAYLNMLTLTAAPGMIEAGERLFHEEAAKLKYEDSFWARLGETFTKKELKRRTLIYYLEQAKYESWSKALEHIRLLYKESQTFLNDLLNLERQLKQAQNK